MYSSPAASRPKELRVRLCVSSSVRCQAPPASSFRPQTLPLDRSPNIYVPTSAGIAEPRYTAPPMIALPPLLLWSYSVIGGTTPVILQVVTVGGLQWFPSIRFQP